MHFFSDPVTSRDNPSVKLLIKLINSKKERLKYKSFALEGSRLVFDALKNNAPIDKLFVTQSAFEKYGHELEKYDKVKIILISDQLGDKISDTGKTQGIFASCRFIEGSDKLTSLKKHGKYVVLSHVQDPGNIGMIIRTADALGLDGVIFSECCDIYNPKVARATMGSLFRIPLFYNIDEDEIFLKLDNAKIPSFAAVVNKSALDLKTSDFSNGGAIIIGNEGNGLSEKTISKCTELLTIKMNGNIESLNAAMAAGIIMWELMK